MARQMYVLLYKHARCSKFMNEQVKKNKLKKNQKSLKRQL